MVRQDINVESKHVTERKIIKRSAENSKIADIMTISSELATNDFQFAYRKT